MQTIARANRVFAGKHSGLIVDYANVLASLERALAIYGKGTGGEKPIRDKKKLVEDLRKAVGDAMSFASHMGLIFMLSKRSREALLIGLRQSQKLLKN